MKLNKKKISEFIKRKRTVKFNPGNVLRFFRKKKTLVIIQSLLIVGFLVYVTVSSVKGSNSDKKTDNATGRDGIVTPTDEKKETPKNFDKFLNYRSYETELYIEGLFRDWPRLLDLFTSNSNFRQDVKDISPDGLEKISDGVKKSRPFSPGNVQWLVDEYGAMIKRECNFYKLDWRLVLAIIRQESYFNPEAVSHAGALGFMQIMPRTGAGLQSQLSLEDTRTPQNNLIAGIYYYASLVSQFSEFGDEKYKFALASYNAGLGRVIDALTIAAYMEKDFKTWDGVKEVYPYLSSKADSVHALVWPDRKRPTYGTLDNWKEPYNYVDNIWFYYTEYKKYYESNLPEEKKQSTKKSKKKKK